MTKPRSKYPVLPRGLCRMKASGVGNARSFHIPAGIARTISESAVFRCELVDEGVLFRYIEGQEPVTPSELPRWQKGES